VSEPVVISLNEPAVLPEREGLTVTGSLPYADADRVARVARRQGRLVVSRGPRPEDRGASISAGGG